MKCMACIAKDMEIAMLKAYIVLLKREIKHLKDIINRTKKACTKIVDRCDKVMSEHQPRGVWSFSKGAMETAKKVLSLLN